MYVSFCSTELTTRYELLLLPVQRSIAVQAETAGIEPQFDCGTGASGTGKNVARVTA